MKWFVELVSKNLTECALAQLALRKRRSKLAATRIKQRYYKHYKTMENEK